MPKGARAARRDDRTRPRRYTLRCRGRRLRRHELPARRSCGRQACGRQPPNGSAAADRAGRVLVEPDPSVPGSPEICHRRCRACPAAMTAGRCPVCACRQAAGPACRRDNQGPACRRHSPRPVRYSTTAIWRRSASAAVIDFGWIKLTGRHLVAVGRAHLFLIGFRNRLAVR